MGGFGYFLGQREIKLRTNGLPALTLERKVPESKNVNFSLFWEVWDRLESSYLDKGALDKEKMVYGAISGLVSSLDDPYTVFLPPNENKEAHEDLRGDFEGVGIQIGFNKKEQLSVVAPLVGTPAEAAGLKAGDVILKIVDEIKGLDRDTQGITLPEAVTDIRGPKGSVVKLTMAREGVREPFEVELKRDTIVVRSVELSFKEKRGQQLAVLKLSRFGERTYEEWQEAVEEIKSKQKELGGKFGGVILDLRNNPGGFLQGAVFIGSEFLSSGVVVQQDRGEGRNDTYSVNRRGQLLEEPLVVLVNGGSASASEIVAGALREAGRAKLVGERTFGKGTVQEAEDLTGGAGLHVTVARWLLPSGVSVDEEGVAPDLEVKMNSEDPAKDSQLEQAIEVLTSS